MSALDGTVELAELLRRFPPAGEREAGACAEPGGPASEGATVTPLSPAHVLTAVCGVGDAVLLAETLLGAPEVPAEVRVDDGRWLAAHVERQIGSLHRWLEKRLVVPHEGRNAVPTAAGLAAWLAEGRGEDEVALPWKQRTWALLRIVRRDGARIRSEAARDLRALGPASARLERVDAGLRRATEDATRRRDEAVAGAVARRFARELRRVDAPGRGEEALRRAFASGWIARIRADADAVCRAALREEASLLRELVGGCAALAGRALEEGSAPARAAAGGGER
ncbi:MAG TPA: hypothetical protein RMH85_09805 [Polyangiaceae bacterium LLY-WYZ-15_(1-7)]|nr:hypothetical protein [Sandaracinus sp.]HJL04335.1 hypothetical protein [Polyangiaceae bacterium LLY-WYZ-15_(1-7)]HJL08783.1 hypothetical protein [Polyangiaceae bacterium LLY-WYZ-15_(1-7)]HJL22421.1 hypothetical protein [Polyangiaceae bacterium LLY-WYZ-15_(1-7)]HJL35536.1 hypothetical protein [Polyangiaceae bacterium LLY-WYZ-15_(1-7)]